MIMDVFKNVVARRNQVLWLMLAFQSGFMNAGGYLAVHRFISHMTGYGTYVGVALAQKQYLGAFEMALAPSSWRAPSSPAGSSIAGCSSAKSRISKAGSSRWPS